MLYSLMQTTRRAWKIVIVKPTVAIVSLPQTRRMTTSPLRVHPERSDSRKSFAISRPIGRRG